MTKFLQNLQSLLLLSDSEIQIFIKDQMTELIHFIELDKNELKEMGFARGPTNAILAHIKSLIPEKTQVIKIESESDDERFQKACDKFNTEKIITEDLKRFATRFVLVNELINFNETKAMLAFKGNPGDIWKGNPIVNLNDLDDSEIWMNPRNGSDLQDGVDSIGIEWILLGQDKMCLVAFAEESGLLVNKDDETVFDAFAKPGKLYDTTITKLKASGKKLAEYIDCVKRSVKNQYGKECARNSTLAINHSQPQSKNKNKALMDLLSNSFAVDEMKRVLRYTVGDDICKSVNFSSSPNNVTFDVVEYLDRNGHTNGTSFWNAILSERPRRRSEIANVAQLYGILI